MSILPLLPIIVLLGGAVLIMLSRVLRFRHPDVIAAAASALALIAMFPIAVPQALETLVSAWQPLSVFGAPVSLRLDRLDWLISLVAILACLSMALAGLAYPGRRRFAPRGVALGMTAALVAAAFSANLLTLALAWGLFDMLFAIGVLAHSGDTEAGRRAMFAVGINGAATVGLWITALILNQAQQSQYWHLTSLPEAARGLLTVVAVLRLGLYPLNQWLPSERDDAPGRVALVYILSPLAGLHILIRLASMNALSNVSALTWLAAVSMVTGGALAWWRGRTRDALPYVALSGIGAVVLSGILTPTPGVALINGAASWALAIMAFSVGRSFDRHAPWWSIGHALAFGTLAGLPATLGFAVRTSLAAGAASSGDWLLIGLIVIGETLMFGALIRMTTAPAREAAPSSGPAIAAYAAAIAATALPPFLLPAIGRSLIPELAPPAFEVVLANLGVLGGVLVALPLVLAIALDRVTRDRPATPRLDPTNIIRLDWLYGFLFRLVNFSARTVSSLAALFEGEGAMLWALLILIAAYVVLSGALG
jgi:formate hydrogenlyase subunit 3/multisubunit Na+/H+ antiporter MnhD subunit